MQQPPPNAAGPAPGHAQPPATPSAFDVELQQRTEQQQQQQQPSEEEMVATERDLAEDAQWKRIQQNTFTRWANEHLKTVNKHIGNLESDLSDGLRLISLIEVLSGKKLPKHNKRPNFRSQKLENVSVALRFLEEDEGIRIVNIDSSDIVDCKLKLILGLIWTLILHYSISIPMWEGEDFFHGDKAGPTPKQRLLGWIQSKIPDLPITNFTSDWNDGRAVGALVDALAPGLCPDWPDWNPKNNLQNAKEAMTLADNWLGVPQLVKPEEMVNPNVDELSMMTYLSQYPAAKLKPNAPLRPRINPNRVRAYGPGIEPTGVVVGAPANFTVETFSAGKGNVEVAVLNPQGKAEPVDLKFNNDRNLTYSATYKPRLEGAHKVSVKFTGKEIPKSPYSVMVEGHAGDPSKVTASGPGLEPTGVTVGKPTYFDIITKDAGRGAVEVIILDPQGNKNTVPTKVRQVEGDLWRCEYMPVASGLHSVNVFFAGQPIPSSPYGVKISPVSDARRVRASGRGLQPTGVRVRDAADFRVFTDGSGEGNLEVKVIGPGGQAEKVDMKVLPDGTTYDCVYHPQKEGRYIVMISFGGKEIARSPFEVAVGPYKESSIRAFGPGLHGGVVGYPALFTVETNGETGALGFSIEGPSQARIECNDNGDGSADVKYHPTAPGEYAVHILCNNEDIPKSPYMAQVIPKTDYFPEKVKAYGPGLEKSGVQLGKQTEFTVDTRASGGHAPLDIKVMDEDYNPIELKIVDNKDGTFKCFYTPKRPVKHTVQVHFGGVAVNQSPFRVHVSAPTNPTHVKVFGPGVEKGVKSHSPTHFNIDCREAGPGDVQVGISVDNDKQQLPFTIQDNDNGTFTVDYTPTNAGNHKVSVFFVGKEIPQSPIKVAVQPHVDVSKVKVLGLEPSLYVDSTSDITVDARAITNKSDAKVVCTINNPSGNKTDAVVQPLNDGTYKVTFTPFEEGKHTVDVTYDGAPVPGSPFTVNMKKGCDPRKCRAFGPGLERGITHRSNQFTVETKGAGTGGLGLAIEGPSESKITCKDNGNGSCSVDYLPTEAGEYDISIKFADQHIPGSPFKVPVDNSVDASRVEAFGPGLEPEHCRANVPLKFVVDSSKSGKAPLAVQVTSEKGPVSRKPDIEDKKDGTHEVTYYAPPEGSKCNVKVTYDGKDIPKSPYQMKVKPTVEPQNVKVSGPGVAPKGVPASIPADFTIDTRDAGFGDLQINVLGPDGQPKKVKVTDNNNGTFKATYLPDDVGPYKVDVKYAGKEVPNSPFTVNAVPTGSADKCKITEGVRQTTVIGEESCISVNAKQAGDGKVTCRVRSTSGSGSDLDIDIQDNKDGTFSIYYTCKETGEYSISVKFGGQPVPGGVYTFRAETQEISQISKRTTTTTTTTRTTTVIDDHSQQQQQIVPGVAAAPLTSAPPQSASPGAKFNPIVLSHVPVPTSAARITAEVKMPSGQVDRAVVVDNHDGTVSIKYEPREEGLHELHIKYNHEHVHGSPFKFHVDTLSSGYVTAYGPGLVHGVCGEPCNFTITTKDAGAGGLSLAVEGPSKADITCHDNKDGTVSVSYLPTAPGEYKASVKFADKHIKGSPFTAKITGEGRKRNQISVGSSSEVSLNVKEEDIRNLSATIRAPSGLEEPVFVKKLPNGNLGISFTPREVGEHDVSVKRLGKHIPKSPFKITVGDREVGDAKKVRVYGNALREGKTHADNTFTIDTKAAGYGGLSLSIEGPSKADITCKDNDDGTLTVGYKPTEPGYYIVNLKFADHHVHGSPFTVKVTGEGSNRQTERIKKEREAVPITEVGSNCRLTFKLPGVSPFDLTAAVTSPSGVTEDAEINDIDEYLYAVNFVPKELGVHTVSVRYKDIHIPGSPFQFTVGPLRDFGAHRVHAGGNGLERGEVRVPSDFNVWTHEAGAGSLAISVEGPSKAEIDFKDRKDGSCYVSYVVTEPGEYRVGVKFNDQHIPDSPFKVYIMPDLGEARKVEVHNMPDTVPVDKPFAFIVNQNGAKGTLDAKAIAPSGAEDDCFLSPLDLDQWALRFVPRENGVHTIHIKFNGVHIPGSPFRVRIGKDDADPAAVHAHGNGLKDVKTGQKTDFIVDTCNAGSGTLAVTIDGPSKVSMDCTEVDEGYKVRYTPLAPGDYYITIKYNSCHIAGSPFKIKCTGDAVAEIGTQETASVVVETVHKQSKIRQSQQNMPKFRSDASKVSCKGMGLKKAYLHKQNTFTVSAQDAGDNMLFCNLHGPKNPTEEVFIKHVGHNNYQVNYQIKDRGDYVLVVKWGEDHIPGSPFRVEVA